MINQVLRVLPVNRKRYILSLLCIIILISSFGGTKKNSVAHTWNHVALMVCRARFISVQVSMMGVMC